MNQPFQELAERAGFKLIRENCYDVVSTMSVQEFAELIIKECQMQTVITACSLELDANPFVDQITKHFGVEE